jgi:tight adherence protein C
MGMLSVTFAVLFVLGGGALAFVGLTRAADGVDATTYLRQLDETESTDEFDQLLRQPFRRRVVKALGSGALARMGSLTPSNYLDKLHRDLLHAGLSGSIRAEEFAAGQAVSGLLSLAAAVAWTVLYQPSPSKGVLALVLLPTVGLLFPSAWLARKVADRKEAIFMDLPDVLDLLAISVEAGLGFEQALDVVVTHFSSPLAEEFSRSLKEMELGLPRKEALQNLKRRTNVPELSNFVLALTQADALGMPLGRILHVQASEMRNKRRAWAREKAAKLPVKILFPLILFIFPAVLVVIMYPAFSSIASGL